MKSLQGTKTENLCTAGYSFVDPVYMSPEKKKHEFFLVNLRPLVFIFIRCLTFELDDSETGSFTAAYIRCITMVGQREDLVHIITDELFFLIFFSLK